MEPSTLRTLLLSVSLLAAVGLAGCTEGSESVNDNPGDGLGEGNDSGGLTNDTNDTNMTNETNGTLPGNGSMSG